MRNEVKHRISLTWGSFILKQIRKRQGITIAAGACALAACVLFSAPCLSFATDATRASQGKLTEVQRTELERQAAAQKKKAGALKATQKKRGMTGENSSRKNYYSQTTMTNLVIYIRFSDEEEFVSQSLLASDKAVFNTNDSSLSNYVQDQSYGEWDVKSVFAGETTDRGSYQDSHPRNYYRPYNAETNPIGYDENDSGEYYTRLTGLLTRAVAWAAQSSGLPTASQLDVISGGDENYIDDVTFMISGYPGSWMDILWPKSSRLGIKGVEVSGVTVGDYQMQFVQNPTSQQRLLGVFAHETMHVFGLPDFYRYYAECSQQCYQVTGRIGEYVLIVRTPRVLSPRARRVC